MILQKPYCGAHNKTTKKFLAPVFWGKLCVVNFHIARKNIITNLLIEAEKLHECQLQISI